MNIVTKSSVPRYKRDGIISHLLVSQITGGSKNLTITLVEMEPGGIQNVHSHAHEQMYFILEGTGTMTVASEQKAVQAGDCIFFPSFAPHGLENTGNTHLRYVSAASPSFTREECEKLWPLKSEEKEIKTMDQNKSRGKTNK